MAHERAKVGPREPIWSQLVLCKLAPAPTLSMVKLSFPTNEAQLAFGPNLTFANGNEGANEEPLTRLTRTRANEERLTSATLTALTNINGNEDGR